MKNSLYKISLFSSIALLVFSSAIFFFLFRETNLNKEIIKENEKIWQQEVNRRDEIRSQNSSFKKIEKEKELLETHFAKSSNVVPFLDSIESLGKKVDVSAEVVLVDVPKEGDNLLINMEVLGSFEKIYKYLLLLENSSYELEIISFDVEKNDSSGGGAVKKEGTSVWKAQIKMKLLSFIK